MALRKRTTLSPPYLLLERPGLPEVNFESARLLRARTGEVGSVPLCSPFLGQWEIYQGFNGKHTHRPPWQHALDFYITENAQSFREAGTKLEDYHCFGLPVIAPAYSQVVSLRNDLPDNTPGEVDTKNNWGNYVLLRLAGATCPAGGAPLVSGLYVLLAHLRQGSVLVYEGAWLQVGDQVASCGNSGRSPQPHLHLQVQASATLGSATLPFHLVNVVSYAPEERGGEFHLALCPDDAMKIAPTLPHPKLSKPLHLPIGRTFNYNVSVNGEPHQERDLRVEVSINGQFRLISDNGASAAFHESFGLLAFYDRQGPPDLFLNLWLLTMGLTPLTDSANYWEDVPSAELLPLGVFQRLLLILRYPLGVGLESCYHRSWEEEGMQWRQEGTHVLRPLPYLIWRMQTTVDLSPDLGVTRLEGVLGGYRIDAVLRAMGSLPDHGIPAVTQPVEGNATG
ncbi:MAG: M23 family metallopeptidase, partial [Nitrospirota bacterium]